MPEKGERLREEVKALLERSQEIMRAARVDEERAAQLKECEKSEKDRLDDVEAMRPSE